MADVKLTDIADVTGTYDSIPTTLTSEAIINYNRFNIWFNYSKKQLNFNI